MWEGVWFILQFLLSHANLLKPIKSLNRVERAQYDGFSPLLSPNSSTNTRFEKADANVNLKFSLNPSESSQCHH